MKKLVLTIQLTFGLLLGVFAQNKPGIAVVPFTANEGISSAIVSMLQDDITTNILSSGKYELVDRTIMDEIEKEKKLQRGESFIDSKVVEDGKAQGAHLLASGKINSYTSIPRTDNKGRIIGYTTEISFTIKLIDVATGKLLFTKMIAPQPALNVENAAIVKATKDPIKAEELLKKKSGENIYYEKTEYLAQMNIIKQISEQFMSAISDNKSSISGTKVKRYDINKFIPVIKLNAAAENKLIANDKISKTFLIDFKLGSNPTILQNETLDIYITENVIKNNVEVSENRKVGEVTVKAVNKNTFDITIISGAGEIYKAAKINQNVFAVKHNQIPD